MDKRHIRLAQIARRQARQIWGNYCGIGNVINNDECST